MGTVTELATWRKQSAGVSSDAAPSSLAARREAILARQGDAPPLARPFATKMGQSLLVGELVAILVEAGAQFPFQPGAILDVICRNFTGLPQGELERAWAAFVEEAQRDALT